MITNTFPITSNHKVHLFIVLLLFCSSTLEVHAQVKHIGIPQTRYYNRHEYQAGTQNWGMAQDTLGRMFFANNLGLLCFDGTNWKLYPNNNKSVVRSIATDGIDRIYSGGYNELGYHTENQNGEYQYVDLTNKIPEQHRNFGEIWRIHATNSGIIFQSLTHVFLYRAGYIQVLASNRQFQYSFYLDNTLYIADKVNGLLKYTGKEFIPMSGGELFAQERKVWSLVKLAENKYFIGTQDSGAYMYNNGIINKWESEANQFIIKNQLFSAIKLSDTHLALGSIQDGIIITDTQGNILQHINKTTGLHNNTVLSLGLDKWDNLWCGLDNGITYIEIHSPVTYLNYGSSIDGSGYISEIYQNNIYLGTNQGLYTGEWKESDKNFSRGKKFESIEALKGQVWSLKVFDDVLICGHNKGTYTIKNNKITQISSIEGGWNYIRPDFDNNLIFGGTYNGLIRLKKKNDEWVFEKTVKGYPESCRDFFIDKHQNIWVSHGYNGIYRLKLNKEMDSVVHVEKYNERNGIYSFTDFYVFNYNDQILFSNYDSIFKYNNLTDRFEYDIYWTNTLGGEGINRFKEDKRGNLWYFGKKQNKVNVVINKARSTYKPNTEILKKLNERFIVAFEHVNFIDTNNIIFGIEEGFAHIDPLLANETKTNFHAYINNLKAFSRNDTLQFRRKILDNPITLEHHFTTIKLNFTASFYENPGLTKYKYRLIGLDNNEWSDWQTNTEVEFTNLGFGDYSFEMIAKNVYGETSKPVSIHWELEKPWYYSHIALVCYTTFILIIIIIIFKSIEKQVEKERVVLQKNQKEEIEKKEKERKREAILFENEIIQLKNDKLKAEVARKKADAELKNKELMTLAIQINHKNDMLSNLKKELDKVKTKVNDQAKNQLGELSKNIDKEVQLDEDWKQFKLHFDRMQQGFIQKMQDQYPSLKPNDLKLCAFLRMNLSTKEIAPLMNISIRGIEIHRYRLRKKLDLSRDVNLVTFLMQQ